MEGGDGGDILLYRPSVDELDAYLSGESSLRVAEEESEGTSSACSSLMMRRTAKKSKSLRQRGSIHHKFLIDWKALCLSPSWQCSNKKPVAESCTKQE